MRALRNFVVVLGSIAVTLVILEGASRSMGILPTQAEVHPSFASGGWAATDPVIGWKNKPGSHQIGQATMTFGRDGGRATSGTEIGEGSTPDIVMIGCSFTQGYGLNDSETMAWRVQASHPDLVIENFGTGGYGAYQSLLMLEDIFKRPQVPKLVIFNFFYWHTVRDIAPLQWVTVFQRGSKLLIAVLDPWPAEDGPQWAEWLPLIRPFQEGTPAVRQFLVDSAAKGRSDFLECSAGNSLDTPQFKLPDGHPNALANAKWADCINEWLEHASKN